MLVSAVTGIERTLTPGVDVVLEVVRLAVNEQFGEFGERAVPVVDAYILPWFHGNGPEAIRFLGQDVEGAWRLIK